MEITEGKRIHKKKMDPNFCYDLGAKQHKLSLKMTKEDPKKESIISSKTTDEAKTLPANDAQETESANQDASSKVKDKKTQSRKKLNLGPAGDAEEAKYEPLLKGKQKSRLSLKKESVKAQRNIFEMFQDPKISPPSTTSSSVKNPEESGHKAPAVAALHNLGNTCFLNSIIQVLRYTPHFVERISDLASEIRQSEKDWKRIMSEQEEVEEESVTWTMVKHLDTLFKAMEEREESYLQGRTNFIALRPYDVISTLEKVNALFENGEQQDAHEFLQCLLGCIQDACKELNAFRAKITEGKAIAGSQREAPAIDMSSIPQLDGPPDENQTKPKPKRGRPRKNKVEDSSPIGQTKRARNSQLADKTAQETNTPRTGSIANYFHSSVEKPEMVPTIKKRRSSNSCEIDAEVAPKPIISKDEKSCKKTSSNPENSLSVVSKSNQGLAKVTKKRRLGSGGPIKHHDGTLGLKPDLKLVSKPVCVAKRLGMRLKLPAKVTANGTLVETVDKSKMLTGKVVEHNGRGTGDGCLDTEYLDDAIAKPGPVETGSLSLSNGDSSSSATKSKISNAALCDSRSSMNHCRNKSRSPPSNNCGSKSSGMARSKLKSSPSEATCMQRSLPKEDQLGCEISSNATMPEPVSLPHEEKSGEEMDKHGEVQHASHTKIHRTLPCDSQRAVNDSLSSPKRSFSEMRDEALKSKTYVKIERYAASAVELERAQRTKPVPDLVVDLFQGTMALRTKCLECEQGSERQENYQAIGVPISKVRPSDSDDEEISEPSSDSQWILSAIHQEEFLREDNKYRCDTCCRLVEACRSVEYLTIPSTLVLHQMRFAMFSGQGGGNFSKVSDFKPTPLALTCLRDKCRSPCLLPEHQLELYAVIMHTGICISSGHYTAYIKAPPGGPKGYQPPQLSPSHNQQNLHFPSPESGTSNLPQGCSNQAAAPPTNHLSPNSNLTNQSEEPLGYQMGDPNNNADGNNNCEETRVQTTSTELERPEVNLDDLWYECDDECVRVLTADDMSHILSSSSSSTPYLLFYR